MRRKKMAVAMLALCLAAGNMMTSLAGWQQLEDKNWKYQNENQSWKADSWFQDVDGKWYHFNKDGLMDKGWFLDADGKWYFLADNGSMQTGLHNVDGRVYYFNPSGDMLMGDKEIYGRVYTFGLYGAENGTPYTPNKWNGAGQQVQTGGGYSSDDDDDSSGSGDNGGSYPDDEKPDPPSGGGGYN